MKERDPQTKILLVVTTFLLIIVIAAFIFIKVDLNEDEVNLYKSEQLLKLYPDSALLLLESIDFPKDLSKKDYALYCQLLVAAHQLNKISIKEDTFITSAVNYYEKKTKYRQNYLRSLLLLGCVYEEQDSTDLAEKIYSEVYNLSRKDEDIINNGISAYELGGLYKYKANYPEAIKWFEKAAKIFTKSTERKMKYQSLRNSADCYLLSGNSDTALVIYNYILGTIPSQKRDIKIDLYKNIAITYKKSGYYNESLEFINKSIKIASPDLLNPIQFLTLASIYEDIGRLDSSIYYNKIALKYAKAQNKTDFVLKAYDALLDTEYPDKFDNYLLSRAISDSIYQKQKYESIKYRKLYDIERIRARHNELIIDSGRYFFLFILVAITATCIFLYMYHSKKRMQIQLYQDIENKENIINTIKTSLYKRLTIYQKMVRLSISPNKNKHTAFLKEYNKIVFDKDEEFSFDWRIANDLCNSIFENYSTRIESLDILSELEKKIFILQKLGFTPSENAIILGKSIHTIYKYCSVIRRKMNIPENESITFS